MSSRIGADAKNQKMEGLPEHSSDPSEDVALIRLTLYWSSDRTPKLEQPHTFKWLPGTESNRQHTVEISELLWVGTLQDLPQQLCDPKYAV
jgi:hypothetical protein